MFKSKQFFVALGLAILIGALVGGVYITQKNNLPEIFDYVPTGMDQVMINRAEQNIQNNTNMLVEIPQAVQEQFQQIKVMLIAQDESFSGEQLLFIQTKSGFSPENFLQTINPEDETISTYLRLADGQYLFAPQKLVQEYSKPTKEEALFYQPQLKKYISKIRRSSLSVISHNNELLNMQKQYSSLLDSAEYLLMHISSDKGKFDFSSYVLFSKPQTGLQTLFNPEFKSSLTESTIAYLEIGKILAGIDFSSQDGTSSMYAELAKKILSNNLAIVVSKGANIMNLGITILSEDETLFSDLEMFFPFVSLRLQEYFGIPEDQITSVQQPGKIGYDVMIQGIQKIGIYLEKSDNETKLTIGNPIIEGKKKKFPKYSKNTLVVLHVDMNQLLGLYKQFANIGANPGLLNESQQNALDQMKDKILYGEVSVDEEKISIEGSIK
ncbi:MAG: hypothetical protein PHR61_00315 [Candidatus Absconditabacteria bacterium]|nr:hypothetical protein [Candidatus Absconditabacteria bacterium]